MTGVGEILDLNLWWDSILENGPYLGYNVNESKSWLIVKKEYLNLASEIFVESAIQITTKGHRHLGAFVGNEETKKKYVNEKVDNWVKQINRLSEFACTQPYAAFIALLRGIKHKYTYVMRTISDLLKPLYDAINKFIKVIFKDYEFNENETFPYFACNVNKTELYSLYEQDTEVLVFPIRQNQVKTKIKILERLPASQLKRLKQSYNI